MKEESLYIVRTDDLRQVEQDSIDAGHSAQNYMQKAAEGIAHIIHLYRHKHFLSNTVLAVVGKGNNGGDAIATALELQRQGMKVHVLLTCSMEELSVLTHHYLTKYIKKRKGKVFLEKPSAKEMKHIDLIIDGYLGSGIKGKPRTLEWIEWMNSCCQKKIAIDVPSGLNEENTNSVHADVTVALECYKDIHLTTQGYEQCGTLEMVPFGLPHAFQKTLTPVAYMVNPERLFSAVSPMKKTQHKYERGYLVVYAGSYANVGCRELVAHAALRTGAGMVRALLHEEDTSELHPIELVSTQFRDTEAVDREVERAKALAIGPGIGKEERAFKALCSLLEKTQIPVVLDADALYRFHDIPSHLTANRTILTPHEGELSYLFTKGENLIEQCAQFAKEHQVILVKKGAPTWIFFPNHKPMVSTYADPGMATAGSGDVLTGIIGAFLAQGVALEDAAPLGVYVHGICGIKAAMQLGSRSVMAHDLVTFLPEVLAHTQTQ